ncbi:hypothetical protein C4E24_07395 [ANME-1 cluster archaeon AG-394-G21]|nr:hypothetical protein [ANME-1 cluster archaeon AG-394-G21]
MNALDILDVKLKMDGVIVAVAHDEFKKMGLEDIGKFMNEKAVLIEGEFGMGRDELMKKKQEKGFIIRDYNVKIT